MILIMTCCLIGWSDVPASSPAAWIAALRDRERTQGRSAWSWQELNDARAAVFDSHYAAPVLTGWLNSAYIAYLQFSPAILSAIMLFGVWVAWSWWRRSSWISSLLLAVLWIVLLWLLLAPLQGDSQDAAVIKTAGALLRQGNGLSYGATLRQGEPVALSAGVEARLLAEQPNGWVQIQLRDGTRGWVPRDAVYVVVGP